MATPGDDEVYIPEPGVEDFEDYTPGGLHPISIGDTFQERRYTVVHKLGHGGYSTIWLARDRELSRYVALKILVADKSARSPEVAMLQRLQEDLFGDKSDQPHPGRRFVPRLLDHFFHDGPNGTHLCLVTEPAVCSARDSKEEDEDADGMDGVFGLDAGRSMTAQLLLGLSYIHSRGICHGDLHLGNFLIRGPSLDHLPASELYEMYGRPETVPIFRRDRRDPAPHAPSHAVLPLRLSLPASMVTDPEIIIGDYGASFLFPNKNTEPSQGDSDDEDKKKKEVPVLHTPALYLPPEDFFGSTPTQAADIWTLAATIHELLGPDPLLSPRCRDRDDIMADLVGALGRPPGRWWRKWGRRGEYYEEEEDEEEEKEDGGKTALREDRPVQRDGRPPFRTLEDRVMGVGTDTDTDGRRRGEDRERAELNALLGILRPMLAYEPDERPSADEVLACEYARDWALPAWEDQCRRMVSSGGGVGAAATAVGAVAAAVAAVVATAPAE